MTFNIARGKSWFFRYSKFSKSLDRLTPTRVKNSPLSNFLSNSLCFLRHVHDFSISSFEKLFKFYIPSRSALNNLLHPDFLLLMLVTLVLCLGWLFLCCVSCYTAQLCFRVTLDLTLNAWKHVWKLRPAVIMKCVYGANF